MSKADEIKDKNFIVERYISQDCKDVYVEEFAVDILEDLLKELQ